MMSKFRITTAIELDPSIYVKIHDGTQISFKKCGSGIYYFDTTNEAFNEDQTTD